MAKTADQRFLSHLKDQSGGCVEWSAGRDSWGYGVFYLNRKAVGAHRYAWMRVHGEIPDGMYVCHTCDNPACCTIAHLFLGTPADNAQDRDRKGRRAPNCNVGKTHCPKGHGFTQGNTIGYGPGNKWRRCRTCRRAYERDLAARKREVAA